MSNLDLEGDTVAYLDHQSLGAMKGNVWHADLDVDSPHAGNALVCAYILPLKDLLGHMELSN